MTGSEPIAVVAMACRLPGGIDTPAAFWDLLAEGGDAIEAFPARWDGLDLFDADRTGVGEGGFLREADRFDAAFFGVSPLAAQAMDPEHRIALETVWEALEQAGGRPESHIGVYLGATDYLDRHITLGGHTGGLAAKVAATLGLRGPEVTVDTACSSSLVALHLAMDALRRGECAVAVAGGVTVMSTPAAFVEFALSADNAADGRCKSLAAGADGTGWAEGCGVLVLKPMTAALADGDEILAVLRGSAVADGGPDAQPRVLHAALAAAGLTPADISYVEAHGAGTPHGDAAEVAALAAVYGRDRARPLWLGSAKSNLGHTQAAAGVTGVIKTVLALRNGMLPQSVHAETPSAHLGGSLVLLAETVAWPRGLRPRRSGVSAFGLSGTNAHVIVEEAPAVVPLPARAPDGIAYPVVLSGHDEAAVRAQAGRWAGFLATAADEVSVLDIAMTAALHRTTFGVRACVTAGSRAELESGLRDVADGLVPVGHAADGGLAMVFTGQGVQRLGTGRLLYGAFPAFAEAFDAVCAELDLHLDRPVRDVVFGTDEAAVHDPGVAQPALFAIGVALFRLWVSWGVLPSAVTGHAVGELAAAHVSGVLSLADASRLAAARGRLLRSFPGGAMVTVSASEVDITALVSDMDVSVVGASGPGETIIAGAESAVLDVVDRLGVLGHRTCRLTVSATYPGPDNTALIAEYGAVVRSCVPAAPELPMVSAMTAEWMGPDLGPGEGVRAPGYWIDQLGGAVRFAEAVRVLEDAGIGGYLECGPGPVPTATARACLPPESPSLFVPSLRGGRDEVRETLAALGALHVAGQDVDWSAVFDGLPARRVALPSYAFQRERYWLPVARSGGDLPAVSPEALPHPWLDAVTATADGEGHLFTGRLSLAEHPWLGEHRLFGTVVVPGTGLVELAAAAADQVGAAGIGELSLARPLVLPANGFVRLRVTLGVEADGVRPIALYSQPGDAPDGWTLHAVGTVVTEWAEHEPGWTHWPVPDIEPVPVTGLHARLDALGVSCGPSFRGLSELARRGDSAYGVVRVPEQLEGGEFDGVHPALLDAALHALFALRPDAAEVLMPVAWRGVTLYGTSGTYLRVRVDLADRGDHSVARLWVTDEEDIPVAYVDELRLRAVTAEQVRAGDPARHLYRVDSVPVTAPAAAQGSTWTLADLPALATLAPPSRLVIEVPRAQGDIAVAVRTTAVAALDLLQDLLSDPRLAETELVWVTRGDLAAAPVRGLVRAARAEYGDRLRLIDALPGVDVSAALSVVDEPELVVRDGEIRAVRLARAVAPDAPPRPLGPGGTVLVTGGTSELGRLVALHLVRRYGVRHLVLTSRQGPFTSDASEVVGALLAAGAQSVRIPACDVANRADLERVLAGIDPRLPLHGVFHLAATADDALLTEQTAAGIERVLAPKVAGALHLDALTSGLDLSAFVLFSSASGVLGAAGQCAHSAANTFLDALAEDRRSRGLAGSSLAWGCWSVAPSPALATVGTLSNPEALRLLDAALARADTHLVPAKLEFAGLRHDLARGAGPPALLRSLIRPS